MGAARTRTQPSEHRQETLIATIGTEPQVVTITLDRLLAMGRRIAEVVIVYTAGPGMEEALATVEGEFAKGLYRATRLRKVAVVSSAGRVEDFRDEEDIRALLGTMYVEVRRARQAGAIVHLCVSGGRKAMGIMGMVVAQLLFGPDDCVWHLVTEGWHPGAQRRLHLSDTDRVWLVSVPVIRWAEAATLMRAVADLRDPREVMEWYGRLSRKAQMKRRRDFVHRWLSGAEREVVRLACKGFDNANIASALHKSEQTVANQLRAVYAKLGEWLDYPEYRVDRSVLIAELAAYFELAETEGQTEWAR
ncbi:MAG: CRISPR-associated ring nuclease [Bacillota bacterium]